jgi:taurine-pyruvate aminotransferase
VLAGRAPNGSAISITVIKPDFVTMAKGVASGYAAISCTVTTEAVFEQFKDMHPIRCPISGISPPLAVAQPVRRQRLRTCAIIEDENLIGEHPGPWVCDMLDNLRALQDKHAVIGDVRGKGLFLGAELVSDRTSREPAEEKRVHAVVADCMGQGIIIGATNRSLPGFNNTLCFSPALIATADDIDRITDSVDQALTRVFG